MEIIDDRPIVVTNRGQLIILDDRDDLALFDKENLVYWANDILALKYDLQRVPAERIDIDLDQLDFDIEEAARLVREGKGYEYISRHLDADVEPERVRKAIDRYIEVNYR